MRRIGELFRRIGTVKVFLPNKEDSNPPVNAVLYDFTKPEVAERNHVQPGYYISLSPIRDTIEVISNPQYLQPHSTQLIQTLINAQLLSRNTTSLSLGDLSISPLCEFIPAFYQPESGRLLIKVVIHNKH